MHFFDVDASECLRLFLAHGRPDGATFKRALFESFDSRTNSQNLTTAYKELAELWSLRLLMKFERQSGLREFLKIVEDYEEKLGGKLHVIDYGCGVSDLGLLLASYGHTVTICDLQDKKLEFTTWRFKRNGLPVNVIPVPDAEALPVLGENIFDLVIACDVLKQVRNPYSTIKVFYESLKPNCLFYCTQGTPETNWFGEQVGGDRLAEALHIGNSMVYKTWFLESFTKGEFVQDVPNWWVSTKAV